MRRSLLLATCLALGPAVNVQAAPVSMSAATQQDVRCFMLFAAAVNDAQKAGNDKVRDADGLGVMYFFSKINTEAPSLNLVDAVMQESSWMTGNSALKEVGTACDAEFSKSAQQLVDIGQKLQQASSSKPPGN